MARVLSRRYQLAILIVAACLLLLLMSPGCGAHKGAQTQISSEQEIARQGKMNELERKIETQTSRINKLISGIQDSVVQWRGTTQANMPAAYRLGQVDTLFSEEIYFDLNNFRLDSGDRMTLDGAALQMAETPSSIIEITGHADKSGATFYNYQLSQQRSDAALRYLLEQYDIPLHRMYSLGFGTENQKYPNDVGNKPNKNRRIEVRLLQLSQSQPVIP